MLLSATAHSVQVVNLTSGSASHFHSFPQNTSAVLHVPAANAIFAAYKDKPVLDVVQSPPLKIILPEKLTAIAVDPRGHLFAGGTQQGRIYVWELASGTLFAAFAAHYRAITALAFTHDTAALVSASEDSSINTYLVSALIDEETQHETPKPFTTLPDHTLPVTALVCGLGNFQSCRIFSSSMDCSVKVWTLSTLLGTFLFPSPISLLAVDPAERFFFAASAPQDTPDHGQIYYFPLRASSFAGSEPNRFGATTGEKGGANAGGVIDVGSQPTALTLSLDVVHLLVGTSQGKVLVYDVPTKQLIRTIGLSGGSASDGSITYLEALRKPLRQNSSSHSHSGDADEEFVVVPFHRTKDAKARETREVYIKLGLDGGFAHKEPTNYDHEELLRDHAYFLNSPSFSSLNSTNYHYATTHTNGAVSGVDAEAASTRVQSLEAEVLKLRDELAKVKGVNDVMWEGVVKAVVSGNAKIGD